MERSREFGEMLWNGRTYLQRRSWAQSRQEYVRQQQQMKLTKSYLSKRLFPPRNCRPLFLLLSCGVSLAPHALCNVLTDLLHAWPALTIEELRCRTIVLELCSKANQHLGTNKRSEVILTVLRSLPLKWKATSVQQVPVLEGIGAPCPQCPCSASWRMMLRIFFYLVIVSGHIQL